MGATPYWIGYVGVDDVDATVDRIKRLGGAVHVPPTDIPNVSRFSIVADPQMATLALLKGLQPDQAAARRAGHTGPRRLARTARRRLGEGVRFLRRAFWLAKSGRRHRRMGTYQRFSAGGQTIGGMFTKPPTVPVPFWLYYFNVGDIDAAAKRVKAGGGQILERPA